jgi:transcriptional regulator with XRE-family HTH domain
VDFPEIKRRREKLGLTQAQAARLAGWPTAQNWSNIENAPADNDPRISTMIVVALALGCKVDDLLRK